MLSNLKPFRAVESVIKKGYAGFTVTLGMMVVENALPLAFSCSGIVLKTIRKRFSQRKPEYSSGKRKQELLTAAV